MTIDDTITVETEKPFSLKGTDFLPFGIGLWNYCYRSTIQAKKLQEKSDDYAMRELFNTTMLCAYNIATICAGTMGIRMLYDMLK